MEWLFTHFSLSKQIFFLINKCHQNRKKISQEYYFLYQFTKLNWNFFFLKTEKQIGTIFFFPAYKCSSLWNLFRLFSLALGKNCFLCFTNNELMNIKRTSWNLFKTKPMILLHIHVYLKLWQRKWNMQNTFIKIHVF